MDVTGQETPHHQVGSDAHRAARARATDGESLKVRTQRLRAAIRQVDGAVWAIAKEIVDVADHWDRYRSEAQCEAARWVHQIDSRRSLAWWREVHAAYERFGARNARLVTWEAARWASKKITADRWENAVAVLTAVFRDAEVGQSQALSLRQTQKALDEFVTKAQVSRRQAARIEALEARVTELEEFITANGLVVPEPRE